MAGITILELEDETHEDGVGYNNVDLEFDDSGRGCGHAPGDVCEATEPDQLWYGVGTGDPEASIDGWMDGICRTCSMCPDLHFYTCGHGDGSVCGAVSMYGVGDGMPKQH